MRVGLIGHPLGHSISPAFQQAAFDALGIDARYELWDTPVESLPEVVDRLRQPEFLGANVTIPHKQAVLEYLDELDATAQSVGAVNTIVRQHSRLIGHNTDVEGFARAVSEVGGRSLADERVVVLGAGGAARAVVVAALLAGAAEIAVCARRLERAQQLAVDQGLTATAAKHAEFRLYAYSLSPSDPNFIAAVKACGILINATPAGMAHGAAEGNLPLPADLIGPDMLVCDLVYNPPLTPLLQVARARGASVLDGLPMLFYQGAAAFELWTGRDAPVALMRRAAEEALGA